jgi:hypothetical protein
MNVPALNLTKLLDYETSSEENAEEQEDEEMKENSTVSMNTQDN